MNRETTRLPGKGQLSEWKNEGRRMLIAHFALLFLALYGRTLVAAEPELPPSPEIYKSAQYRQKLITDYENSPTTFTNEHLLDVATSYLIESNYDRAEAIYDGYLRSHTESPRALRGKAYIFTAHGRSAEAIQLLHKALSLGDTASLQTLAALFLNNRKFDEVRKLLPDLRAHLKDDGVADCLLGLAISEDPPNQPLLMEALDAQPIQSFLFDKEALPMVEFAINRLHRFDETNKTLRIICERMVRAYSTRQDDWPVGLQSDIGTAYFMLEDYESACDIFRSVLKAQPDNKGAVFGLGLISAMKGDFPDAISKLRPVWAGGETDALPSLAFAYLATSDSAGMKDLMPDLLRWKGEDMECLNSILLYALGRDPIDKELFNKALEGISDDQILRRKDTTDTVLKGLKISGDEKHFQKLLQLKTKQESGLGG